MDLEPLFSPRVPLVAHLQDRKRSQSVAAALLPVEPKTISATNSEYREGSSSVGGDAWLRGAAFGAGLQVRAANASQVLRLDPAPVHGP